MTRITAVYGADALTLTARGHATGSPAACAAVSALLYALEGTLPLPLGEVPPQGAERAGTESPQALSVTARRAEPAPPEGEPRPSSVFRLAGDGESHLPPLGEGIAAIAPGAADFVLPRTPAAEAAFDVVVTGLRRVAATAPAAVAVEIAAAPLSSRETLNPAQTTPHGSGRSRE